MTAAEPLRVALTVEQCWQPVPGGSGTYVVELGRELGLLPDVRVRGLAARHDGPPPADWTLDFPVDHAPLPRTALYEAWNRLRLPRAEHVLGDVDLVHAATWAVPPTRRPLVVTVHDLAFLDDPSHFTRRGNAFFRSSLARVVREAAAVIAPSRATADACLAVGLDARRTHVVPHGARVPAVTTDDVARFSARYGLDRPYVLWCGTLEPRKNLPTLLAAYERSGLHDDGTDLVLVGPQGWGDGAPASWGAGVRHLGPLSRPDLHAAYAGARAFAFPSVREGFGLPVLEAMTHAVPVVTGAGTACAEVAGDAALLVPVLDVDAWATALRAATGAAHDELTAASRERSRAFSWATAARQTLDVYRSVLTA
nr:glycosyltransferase family 1 protein [uncultured Actinotalea sp.]